MSSSRNAIAAVLIAACAVSAGAQGKFPGIGRDATPKEVAAWDIDVRPDFKGLPPGKGTVAQGQDIWEERCASCHGFFGESNSVFMPLVGGTTADDVKTGRVATLRARLESLHPYEVPEFLICPVADGSAAYLGWVRSETTTD